MLLALALISLIVAAVVELPRATHDVWMLGARRSELQGNARLGLDFIVRELRQAQAVVEVSGAGDTDGLLRYIDDDSLERRFDRRLDATLGHQVLALDGVAVADVLDSVEVTGMKADAVTETTDPDSIRAVVVALTFSDPEQVAAAMSVRSTILVRQEPEPVNEPFEPRRDIIVLADGDNGAFTIDGKQATVDAPDHAVTVNSSHAKALRVKGKAGKPASLTASSIDVVGGTKITNATVTPDPSTGAAAQADPLASLSPPDDSGGCDYVGFSLSNETGTLYPGTYCDGITLEQNAVASLEPGTYIIRGGGIEVSSSARLEGDGVCIYLTSGGGYAFGGLTVDDAEVDLSAPTTGDMTDILFFGDRSATGERHEITGGSQWQLAGVLYFPTQTLAFDGNSSGNGDTALVQIVVDLLEVTDGALVDFTGTGEGGGDDGGGGEDPCDGIPDCTVVDGGTSGDQEVGKDETLIVTGSATIEGDVEMNRGTLIVTDSSTITGNIKTKGKKKGGTVTLEQGAHVEGNVELDQGDGDLTIEDAIIDGNVYASENNTVIITDSTIDGNVEALDNESITVTGNTIITGNTGPCP